jgi:hypothetical protein
MKAMMVLMSVLMVMGTGMIGCDSDGAVGASGSVNEGGTCSVTSECAEGTVCLVTLGVGLCQLDCSLSADECSASASCKGVGSLEVNVCQEKEEEEETATEDVSEEDIPYIPCATDADCTPLDPVAICAEFRGRKDCTIPCDNKGEKSECNMPPIMGVSIDFLICNPDEADTSRLACLPDEACFSDMMSCMDLGMFDGGMGDAFDGSDDGSDDGFGDFDDDFDDDFDF